MLGALAFSHLLMPVALTLLGYKYLCQHHVRNSSLGRRRK